MKRESATVNLGNTTPFCSNDSRAILYDHVLMKMKMEKRTNISNIDTFVKHIYHVIKT